MKRSTETIAGDTDGVAYSFPVYRFAGRDTGAPSAYIQAALHADELPGTVAIHALMPLLRMAEEDGRINGAITVVPAANPIGRSQYLFGARQGRFHLGTRTNFNREFPKLARPDRALLPPEGGLATADQRLKARLVGLSLRHDIVLDLHCDDEGVSYLYLPAILWPAMADCAVAMGVEAVVLWDGESTGEFEEAAIHPHLAPGADLSRKVVTTAELRGEADVYREHAEADGRGLYRLLVARGVVADETLAPLPVFKGVAAPIGNIEMVKSPRAGAVLYDVKPGDRVKAGQRLATVVHAPGEEDGSIDVLAPQAGYVLTRRSTRALRANEDLLKLVGEKPSSAIRRQGALEA
ncbi:MAG: succinylglutamate desuccinylase/aspartoacylase family protein [Rhizobiaceae bacterium]